MSAKEAILKKCHTERDYPMPSFDDIQPVKWDDPLTQFIAASKAAGAAVVSLEKGETIEEKVGELFPGAGSVRMDTDDIKSVRELDGTEVALIRGDFGVAENGCIWIPQRVSQRALYFIAEHLVILLRRDEVVNNMHEAMDRLRRNDYGYGCFISGPSKTADIAQVLVMGAQAARSVTVLLLDRLGF